MSVAVFGGAFDPPHLGHVALVRTALEQFGFERILVVPAGDPPHKKVFTSADIRARLTELAFDDIPQVEISTCELEPGGPRYTVDTLFLLGEKHDDLTLLVGADQFAGFLHWREPDTILSSPRWPSPTDLVATTRSWGRSLPRWSGRSAFPSSRFRPIRSRRTRSAPASAAGGPSTASFRFA
jgi:cytidyltransferase-like protein